MTFSKNIKDRMNMALASKGRTFVLNPRSKFQVRRKIKDVRLTLNLLQGFQTKVRPLEVIATFIPCLIRSSRVLIILILF